MMEMKLDNSRRRSNKMLVYIFVLLISQNLVLVPAMSATTAGSFDDLKCVSPPPPANPYGGSPPSGTPPSGSHGSPPGHGRSGGGGTPTHRSPPSPSCGGGGGSTPGSGPGTTPTPTTPGGGGGGGSGYTPAPSTGGSPPLVLSPPPTPIIEPGYGGTPPPSTPYIDPGTGGTPPYLPGTPSLPGILPGTPSFPGILPGTPTLPGILPGTPPFLPDPNSNPFSGTCNFWRNNPGLIWGLLGWWGSLGSLFGLPSLPSVSPSTNLRQAVSIPDAADGFPALYREASAAYLNSLAYHHYPYSTKQVRDQFAAALHSNDAAAHQARVFKLANEGRIKPRV